MDFPFKTTSIEEPFQTATYNKTEYFGQYGLNKKSHRKTFSTLHPPLIFKANATHN